MTDETKQEVKGFTPKPITSELRNYLGGKVNAKVSALKKPLIAKMHEAHAKDYNALDTLKTKYDARAKANNEARTNICKYECDKAQEVRKLKEGFEEELNALRQAQEDKMRTFSRKQAIEMKAELTRLNAIKKKTQEDLDESSIALSEARTSLASRINKRLDNGFKVEGLNSSSDNHLQYFVPTSTTQTLVNGLIAKVQYEGSEVEKLTKSIEDLVDLKLG